MWVTAELVGAVIHISISHWSHQFSFCLPWCNVWVTHFYRKRFALSNLRSTGLDFENVKYISYEDHVEISKRSGVERGDILFAMIGTIGNPVVVKTDATFSIKNVGLFKKNPEVIQSHYLKYWLESWDLNQLLQERELIKGTTQRFIPLGHLRILPVPLAPLAEQERIVAEIEKQFTRLDQAVVSLRRLQTNLARYKASVLKAACEGRLVPQDPNDKPAEALLQRILTERRSQWQTTHPGKKYPELTPVDTSNLPNLPESWVWATVEQVAANEPNSITDGPFGSKLKTAHYTEAGPRVIRLQNIGNGEFVDEKAHISEEHYDSLKKHRVFAGDLVIAGLGVSLPRSCIIPDFVGLAIVKADCIRVKPHLEIALGKYLNAALNSEPLKKFATNIVHGIGRPRLNQQEIKSLAIPLPPLAEQHRIVAEVERRLSVITATEQTIITNLARAERLRQSILHRAFTGQLVLQNPADKPASSLFARIREQAERLKSTLQEQAALKKQSTRKKPSQVKSLSQTTLVTQPMKRTSLFETLLTSTRQMKVESLFDQSGFTHEIVDEFYRELRDEVIIQKRIEVIHSDEDEIFVRVIPNAN